MNVEYIGASGVIDKSSCRDGDMAHCLRLHTIVAHDSSLNSTTHVGQLTTLVPPAARTPTYKDTQKHRCRHRHTHLDIHRHIQTHKHRQFKIYTPSPSIWIMENPGMVWSILVNLICFLVHSISGHRDAVQVLFYVK